MRTDSDDGTEPILGTDGGGGADGDGDGVVTAVAGGRRVLPERGVDSWRWDVVAILVTMVVVVAFNWLHVAAYRTLSPVDELQHVDTLYKAGRGEMVGRGDLVGDEAMHEEACRGIDAADGPKLPCLPLGSYHASQFQEGGQNTAYIHSPVYYFTTAWTGKVVIALTPIDNLMKAARLLGPMWILPALLLMVPTMRRLGAGVAIRTAAALLAVTVPMVLHATSTVNPDATALLGGALVLCPPILLAGRWQSSRGRVLDGVAAAASMALKPSNIVVLIAGLWLRVDLTVGPAAVTGVRSSSRELPARWRRHVPTVLAAVVPLLIGAGVVSVVMLLVQANLAHTAAKNIVMVRRFMVDGFPWAPFAGSFVSTGWYSAGGVDSNYLAPFLRLPMVEVTSGFVALGSLAVTVVAALRSDRTAAIARSVLVATVLGAPALIVVNYLLQGIFVFIPGRYFMSLVPGTAIVCAATVGRWRSGVRWIVGAAAVWIGVLGFALVAGA